MLAIKAVFLVMFIQGSGGEKYEIAVLADDLVDCKAKVKSLVITAYRAPDAPENVDKVKVTYGCKEVKPVSKKIEVGYSF